MTNILLLRHASHDLLGKRLAGRADGVRLNEQGARESERLVHRLAGIRIDAIYTSPRERTRETAVPLAQSAGLVPQVSAGIDEIDFGDWTGKTFHELEGDPQWPVWVNRRSAAQPPNGETIAAVQQRALGTIETLARKHPRSSVALVSHGDVIKSVFAKFLGVSLDDLEGFDVAPASISVIQVGAGWARVTLLNDTGGFPAG